MAFVRLLDESDHEPFDGVVIARAPPPQRAVARARPKRPRKPTNASLRAQMEALELVVKNLPDVLENGDDDSTNAGDPESRRIRAFLKRTVVLTKQAQEEITIRTEYLRLLKNHHEGSANLRKLMRGLQLDNWFWMCDRWRAIALESYKPLSESKCNKIVQETLQAIKAYSAPESTSETGAFGWRDSIRLDADGHYVRFVTCKALPSGDIEQLVDHSWAIYADGDLFKSVHLGRNCEYFIHVLQRISPDVMILQRVEKYPDLVQLTHSLVIVFRVKTETGHMIVFRCIESPKLQRLMKVDGLSLAGTFYWETFDVAHRDAQGDRDAIQFTLTGSIGSDNPTYAKRWRNELVIALTRYEIQFLDAPMELVTEEDSNVASDSQATAY